MTMEQTSINSLEGWNQATEANNRIAFMNVFGRNPRDVQEVDAWIDNQLAGCTAKTIRCVDEIVLIDGEARCTRWFHYD